MAKQSRVKKYQGQLKRENSVLKRAVEQAQQAQARATALVLGLLVQAGGDVVMSQDTTNTMNKNIARMGYQIVPTPEGLVKVVLVMQDRNDIESMIVERPIPPATEVPTDGKILLTD